MSRTSFQIRNIEFSGPGTSSTIEFYEGVNVICGSSDTGKSFLAESIDYMLGASQLRAIDEINLYDRITLSAESSAGDVWSLERSTAGGGFKLLTPDDEQPTVLKAIHAHGTTDNLSGFLLEKLGLLEKKVLRSGKNSTTQSLGFRNLARLAIVQEDEIQGKGSPFWSGQFTTKTAELATVKLILTDIDDSAINTPTTKSTDNSGKVLLLEDLITELRADIGDEKKQELEDQLRKLNASVERQRASINLEEQLLAKLLSFRQTNVLERREIQGRIDEIADLISRFGLLRDHYDIDNERLEAIRESGSLLMYVDSISCPMCGTDTDTQRLASSNDGDISSAILAATAEIRKIDKLKLDLIKTIDDLLSEEDELTTLKTEKEAEYNKNEQSLNNILSPKIMASRAEFESLYELKLEVSKQLSIHSRIETLEKRRNIFQQESTSGTTGGSSTQGIPDIIGYALSGKISTILSEWNFPGECRVHFDKSTSDFVIDGKPRGSRGKGLRSITHAAVSIGLLEYAQENDLPHPGFLVLDSPLLAYFKPEGDDELLLRGSNLKEKFYEYLIRHHKSGSQIIVIENQHPPSELEDEMSITVFTNNPSEGRAGLL